MSLDLSSTKIELMSIKTLREFAKRLKNSGGITGAISKLSRQQLLNKLTPFQEQIKTTIIQQRAKEQIRSKLPKNKSQLVKIAKTLKQGGFIKGGVTNIPISELKEKIVKGKEKEKEQPGIEIDPIGKVTILAKDPIINRPKRSIFGETGKKLKEVKINLEDKTGAVWGRRAVNPSEFRPKFTAEFDIESYMEFITEKVNEFKEDFTKVAIRVQGFIPIGKDDDGIIRWQEKHRYLGEKFFSVDDVDLELVVDEMESKFASYDYVIMFSQFSLVYGKDLEITNGGCNTKSKKTLSYPMFGWAKVEDPPTKDNNCGVRCILEFLKKNKLVNNKKIYCNKLREDVGLEKKTVLTAEQLSKITDLYKVNLIVYNFKKEIIFQTQGYEHTCELLLAFCDEMMEEKPKHSLNEFGHYVLVTDNEYYNQIICEHCLRELPRKAIKRATHQCDPNVLSYVNTYVKTKNKTEGLKFMYSKANKNNNELAGLDRCHVFDFETFPLQQKQNVYSYGIYNPKTGYQEDYGKDSMNNFIDHIVNIPPVCEKSTINRKAKYDKEGNLEQEACQETVNVKQPQYAIAYNGSRFDFHFVISELTKRQVELENVIINHGAILGFTIKVNNLKFWDINQHIGGSLKKALKDFKCTTQKGDFNHFKIKSWEDVEKYKDEWQPYLKSDVMGLAQLVEKYTNAVWHIFDNVEGLEEAKFDPKEFLTLASTGYKIWQYTVFGDKKRDPEQQTPSIEIPNKQRDIKDIRKSTYGGRTYPLQRSFKSKHYARIMALWKRKEKATTETEKNQILEQLKDIYKTLDDYIFNGDITSLYPTAMRYCKYPRAQSTRLEAEKNPEQTKEELKTKLNNRQPLDYLCILEVKLTNTNRDLVVAPLPKPKTENNRRIGVSWDIEDIEDGWYTNIDLEHAIEFGYKIDEIYDGMLYKDGVQEIFTKYVDTFLAIKQHQDNLKNSGSPDYNPALRAVAKLFLNSLYGKTLQKPIYVSTEICKSAKDIYKFWNTHTVSECLISDDGETVILTGTKIDVESCNTKPNHFGAFLLSYSRRVMLECIKALNPKLDIHSFTYTDTDSLHIHSSLLYKLKDKVNPINGKKWFDTGLGCLSNDIDDGGLIIREINYAPKQYYYVYITENGEVKSSHKSKGIANEYLDEDGSMKKNLDDELYEQGESKTIHMKNRLKKVGYKPNNVQTNAGLKSFDIISTDMTRTWNPDWQMDRQIDGKYYPKGHRIFNE